MTEHRIPPRFLPTAELGRARRSRDRRRRSRGWQLPLVDLGRLNDSRREAGDSDLEHRGWTATDPTDPHEVTHVMPPESHELARPPVSGW